MGRRRGGSATGGGAISKSTTTRLLAAPLTSEPDDAAALAEQHLLLAAGHGGLVRADVGALADGGHLELGGLTPDVEARSARGAGRDPGSHGVAGAGTPHRAESRIGGTPEGGLHGGGVCGGRVRSGESGGHTAVLRKSRVTARGADACGTVFFCRRFSTFARTLSASCALQQFNFWAREKFDNIFFVAVQRIRPRSYIYNANSFSAHLPALMPR